MIRALPRARAAAASHPHPHHQPPLLSIESSAHDSRARARPGLLSCAIIISPVPSTSADSAAMYSNSNAYLGGGGAQRPGSQQQQQPQYGAGSFGGQQQPGPFAPQPTGYGQQQPMQQQYTGFPGPGGPGGLPSQPLQQQYTGFPGPPQPQQSFQTGAPPMPSIPPQFQQQFQQQQQQSQPQQSLQPPQQSGFSSSPQQASGPSQPPAPMKPQATGFHEMAASFHAGGAPKSQPRQSERTSTNKIPNIRLSFITAPDQAKFETLFKSAVGDGATTMSGEKARELLMRSKLDGDALSQIW